MKFTNWFKGLNKSHQVALLASIIVGICTIIAALISVVGLNYSKQITTDQKIPVSQEVAIQKYKQQPEVKRLNADVLEYIKQIDNKTNTDEKQRLLDIVFNRLGKSCEIDPNDGETWFLLAEAYLRKNDYDNTINHYDTALSKQYFFESDVYLGYGIVYEALGDQFISNNDLTSADVYYSNSIKYLNTAMESQNTLNKDNDKIENILTRVKFKKWSYEQAEKYFITFSIINKDSNNINSIHQMIELANNYADLRLWKNAVRCYYWLFKQNTLGQRRIGIIRDFQYFSDFWEFSDDFKNDISINSVRAIINRENVNFRKEPIIDNNTIREFKLHEEIQILQRSDFKQSIGNVRTYWYKICTDDGIEGWVYGQYLCFYPNFSIE